MKKTTTLLLCSLFWLSASAFNAFADPAEKSVLPGDSNCDGAVDVMDVIATISYIMGNNPQPFCFENADVNGDGSVNAIDVIGTINIILSGGNFICGTTTLTDIDGNVYNTVLISDQCWMKENLKTTKYRNGTPIENPTGNSDWMSNTSGAYAWYNNLFYWKDRYGALYNWHAVNNANGLCPTGWHVPTDAEWTQLISYVVSQGHPNQYGDPNGTGNALKSCRQVNSPSGGDCNTTVHPRWESHATHHGFDAFGFGGLPGGIRFWDGEFSDIGGYGYWYSSTSYGTIEAWGRTLGYNYANVYRLSYNKGHGRSIRCLRD